MLAEKFGGGRRFQGLRQCSNLTDHNQWFGAQKNVWVWRFFWVPGAFWARLHGGFSTDWADILHGDSN